MFEFQRILFEKALCDSAPGTDLVVTSAGGFDRVWREHAAQMVPADLESLLLLLLLQFPPAWPHQSLLWARQEKGSLSHRDSRGSFLESTPCLPSHLVTASFSCVPQVTSQGQRQRQELLSFSLVTGKILV